MISSDKNKIGKQGSGRVSMLRSANLIHSYTLECNYNTGMRRMKLLD